MRVKSSITEPLIFSTLPLILADIDLAVTWVGPVLALEVSVSVTTDPTLRRHPLSHLEGPVYIPWPIPSPLGLSMS